MRKFLYLNRPASSILTCFTFTQKKKSMVPILVKKTITKCTGTLVYLVCLGWYYCHGELEHYVPSYISFGAENFVLLFICVKQSVPLFIRQSLHIWQKNEETKTNEFLYKLKTPCKNHIIWNRKWNEVVFAQDFAYVNNIRIRTGRN